MATLKEASMGLRHATELSWEIEQLTDQEGWYKTILIWIAINPLINFRLITLVISRHVAQNHRRTINPRCVDICQSSDLVSKGNNKAWRVPTFIILHARKTKSFCRVQWGNKTKGERKIVKTIQISLKAARDASSDWTNWSFPCSCYVKA